MRNTPMSSYSRLPNMFEGWLGVHISLVSSNWRDATTYLMHYRGHTLVITFLNIYKQFTVFAKSVCLWSGARFYIPPQSQCRGVLVFPLICAWTNDWANNREAGDLRSHRAHYDITVMIYQVSNTCNLLLWYQTRLHNSACQFIDDKVWLYSG